MTPRAFERQLREYVGLYGAASSGDEDPVALARESLEQLKVNPSLRVYTTPRGPVFYEDPLLDAAWSCVQAAADAGVGFAAEGEDLNYSLIHWIPVIVPLLHGRLARNRDVLKSLTPTVDVDLDLPARIAIFGDAGYRGLAQKRVLEMIAERGQSVSFQSLIHLGDTYHGGGEGEMLRHLVTPLSILSRRLSTRAFTLCGNHDLYAGPDGYISAISVLNQPGRFFAIETPGWRLACLDSTLGDTSLRCMSGRIDDAQINWLTRKQDDGKRLIALTHHVARSAWDAPSGDLMRQIEGIPGLFAWYWGHEHRSAAYNPADGIRFPGGCVGNGAFLEPWTEPQRELEKALAWYPRDGRCTCFGEGGRRHWPHGYLELELREDGLSERFYLEGSSRAAFTRNFTCQGVQSP